MHRTFPGRPIVVNGVVTALKARRCAVDPGRALTAVTTPHEKAYIGEGPKDDQPNRCQELAIPWKS